MKTKIDSRYIVMTALLIAMQIVLRRILSFNTLMNSVGFGFVPIVISAMCYGPVNSVIVYSIADIIGSILWPTGPYFPGFTLTAAISGLIYGLLLYKKPQKNLYCYLVVLCSISSCRLDRHLGSKFVLAMQLL